MGPHGTTLGGLWRSLVEGAVGPVLVVMLDDVDDEAFELALVQDDGAIEELGADGSDLAFSERVGYRSPDRGLEDI